MLAGEAGKAPDVAYDLAADIKPAALEKCASEPGVVQNLAGLPVFFDFKSPNSYLALPGLLAARDEGIELQWHPFDHKPLNKPAPQQADEDRGTRHRRIRGEYIAGDLQRYAPHKLHDPYLATNCDVASTGVLWLQANAPTRVDDYVERVFLALWRDGLDVESPAVIAGLLDAAVDEGVFDADGWRAYVQGPGLQALTQAYDRAREQGVSYAPTFYLGSEPFQGRAQLPLILARLRAGV
jgi:2-hydroxychromene-2-carboxylate isomerase